MGMDLYGKNQDSEVGRYFRNNVWWWAPLANYCLEVAPEICSPCEHWYTNDGDGLNEVSAVELARVLQAKIDSGECQAYKKQYEAELNALPNERCVHCHGTGTRNDAIVQGPCNACEGEGFSRPFETWYSFNVENVQEFINFLRDCGGFEIH